MARSTAPTHLRLARLGTAAGLTFGLCLGAAGSAAAATPSTLGTPNAQHTASTPSTPAPPAPIPCQSCWQPPLDTSWDWWLSKVPQAPYRDVQMLDVDGFETTKADVASMHAAGIKVICYIDAGTWEKFRPDEGQFPKSLLGDKNGWPGERWLDIRNLQQPHSILHTIMDARLQMCADKGFDGVELDNVDGYTNKTGFPLTAADQLFYNSTLANDAHQLNLTVLQKNDNSQITELLPYFDAALNEQCNQYHECTTKQTGKDGYDEYIDAGKAVFQAEYKLDPSQFCAADNANDFNGVRFDLQLNGKTFEPCRS